MALPPMPPHFNPLHFGAEILYALIIILFCFLVYVKTRELYTLTKHKGIQFFRYAFIFFGLAYISRFLLFFVILTSDSAPGPGGLMRTLMPISNLAVAFFSTMAILYLAYSTVWKRIDSAHFVTFASILSLMVGIVAFVSRSAIVLSLVQIALMIFAVILIFKNHSKGKRKFGTKTLYLLIYVFWIFSLLVLNSRRFIPFEAKVIFQVVSIAVFVFIYIKVAKWVK